MKYLMKMLAMAMIMLSLTSCFKDEPANSEADLLEVTLHSSDWNALFFNESDLVQEVPYSGNNNTVVFRVKPNADLTALALDFKITEGATIVPASGTVLDFSKGPQTFTVTSEDGKWSRTYQIGFVTYSSNSYYSLDNGHLDQETGKFYVWDGLCTANMGYYVAKSSSAKAEEYPTVYSENGLDGGCAVLRTVDTGAWGAMMNKRIAAGNLFIGTFDITKALSKPLQATRFGEPIDKKPLRYCGHFKYTPGARMQNSAGQYIDGTDEGAIYAVVYKNHDAQGNAAYLTGEDVMTSPLIVGLARMPQVPATKEWTPFSLDFNYTEDLDPELLANHGYSMVFVCSASKDGDLFQGAVGSEMWVDEIRIIFEGEE